MLVDVVFRCRWGLFLSLQLRLRHGHPGRRLRTLGIRSSLFLSLRADCGVLLRTSMQQLFFLSYSGIGIERISVRLGDQTQHDFRALCLLFFLPHRNSVFFFLSHPVTDVQGIHVAIVGLSMPRASLFDLQKVLTRVKFLWDPFQRTVFPQCAAGLRRRRVRFFAFFLFSLSLSLIFCRLVTGAYFNPGRMTDPRSQPTVCVFVHRSSRHDAHISFQS